MLNKNSPASHQPLDMLERLGEILRWGKGGEGDDALETHPSRKDEKQEDEYSHFPTPRLAVFCLASK